MEVLLIVCTGIINVMCFFIGAKVGQKVQNNEPITMPEVNPVKAFDEWQERKEAKREKNRRDVILENIEAYDGTGVGQKDIPR